MVIYRYVLPNDTRQTVTTYIIPLNEQLDKCVPLTFMLAFFVTVIVDRWKNIFANIGFIENSALAIATLVRGDEEEVVLARRTIIRYLVLSQVLVFRDISMKVRRRFPNNDAIIKAGFLQEHEALMLDDLKEKYKFEYNLYWVPINWASSVLQKVFVEGKISAAPLFNSAWQELKTFRSNMAILCNFDWVPIPLAYPQVIFVAVRFYFFMCLFTRQHLETGNDFTAQQKLTVDYYFPLLTVFQFIFLMGWMKVAEGLLNPLGEDDDDFECNFLIDKNIATGMAIVDTTYNAHPEMKEDIFKDPSFRPIYTKNVIDSGVDHALMGSAQTVMLAEPNDNVDMQKVDLNSPVVAGKADSTIRRRLSSVFGRRVRSHSVQPVSHEKVEMDTPFSQSMAPQRPYGAFELSNGFTSGFSNSHLPKLNEEEGESNVSVEDNETTNEPTVLVIPRAISEDATSPTLPFNTEIRGDLEKNFKF